MNVYGIEYSGEEMILPNLFLPSRINQRWSYSGIDSPDLCPNKEHFQQYPHHIEYVYNSRGFRDAEWPDNIEELQQAIWCIGDSFTVGVGSPLTHIWPQVLSQRLDLRTINVSMDGASNDWIVRRSWDIINAVQPKYMIVMWSYTHRTESPREDLNDEARRIHISLDTYDRDHLRWLDAVEKLRTTTCRVIQTAIPYFDQKSAAINEIESIWGSISDPSWPSCPETLTCLEEMDQRIRSELKIHHNCYEMLEKLLLKKNQIMDFCLPDDVIYINPQLDLARDYHHFDILTSQWLVDQIIPRMI